MSLLPWTRFQLVAAARLLGCSLVVVTLVLGAPCGELAGQVAAPARSVVIDRVIDGASHHLGPISQIVAFANGNLAVLEPLQHEIRILDSHGADVATIGSATRQPIAIRSLSRSGRCGDTLWIADAVAQQTDYLTDDGRVARVQRWPQAPDVGLSARNRSGMRFETVPRAVYPGGSRLVAATPTSLATSIAAAPATFVRLDPGGAVVRTVAAAMPARRMECPRLADTGPPVPFCAHELAAVSGDGSRIAIVSQHNVPGGEGAFQVIAIGQLGDTVFRRVVSYVAQPITRADAVQTLRATAHALGVRGVAAEPGSELLDHLPPSYPPVRRLYVGDDRSTWIELTSVATGPRWLVMDPTGRTSGLVDLPPGTSLLVATMKAIWTTRTPVGGRTQDIVRYAVH